MLTAEQMREASRVHEKIMEIVERPFGGADGFKAWLLRLPMYTRLQVLKQASMICSRISAKLVPEACGEIAAGYFGQQLKESADLLDQLGGRSATPDALRAQGLERSRLIASDANYFTQRAIYTAVLTQHAEAYLGFVYEVAREVEKGHGPKLANTSAFEDFMDKDYGYLFGETRIGQA